MNIEIVSADLASRVDELVHDCPQNRQDLIAGILRRWIEQEVASLPASQREAMVEAYHRNAGEMVEAGKVVLREPCVDLRVERDTVTADRIQAALDRFEALTSLDPKSFSKVTDRPMTRHALANLPVSAKALRWSGLVLFFLSAGLAMQWRPVEAMIALLIAYTAMVNWRKLL